jgi:hypothetical protein
LDSLRLCAHLRQALAAYEGVSDAHLRGALSAHSGLNRPLDCSMDLTRLTTLLPRLRLRSVKERLPPRAMS